MRLLTRPFEASLPHSRSRLGRSITLAALVAAFVTALGLAAPAAAGDPTFRRYAFFADWEERGIDILRKHVAEIDLLIPVWVHLASARGDIELEKPDRQLEVTRFLATLKNPPQIAPLINNFVSGSWDGQMAAAVLASPAARSRLVSNLVAYVRKHRFSGISVDFESLAPEALPDLQIFAAELDKALAGINATLSLAIPLFDPAWRLSDFAPHCDAMILLGYDEHSASTSPGPVASQDWFEKALRTRFAEVHGGKLVVGIGSYGYDWGPSGQATPLRFDEAIHIAEANSARPLLDSASLNPGYTYRSENNELHRVWYLDGVTAYNQVRASLPYAPHGFALWRIGAEDPSIWSIFQQLSDPASLDPNAVRNVVLDDHVHYSGAGEVLRFSGYPREGRRNLSVEPATGKITAAGFKRLPRAYRVTRSGRREDKVLALTFDDGPHPAFTPELLRTLAKFDVPATFFVMGSQAEQHPEIISDIFAAGHEIGNHTWTHSDLLQVGAVQITHELQWTKRLLADVTGRRARLFRPPFAAGLDPASPSELAPLIIATAEGYYTVGMSIDPQDWSEPSSDVIVSRVLQGARAGAGNIILLHDSGGDRSATIAAVPRIIETLKGEGFRFVRVSELLGLSSAEIMPHDPGRPN